MSTPMRSEAHRGQGLQENRPLWLQLQVSGENLQAEPICSGGNFQPAQNRFKGRSHCLGMLTTPPPTTHESGVLILK